MKPTFCTAVVAVMLTFSTMTFMPSAIWAQSEDDKQPTGEALKTDDSGRKDIGDLSFDVIVENADNPLMTKEGFVDQSVLYEESPVSDEKLAYRIYLPKSWEKISEDKLENYKLSRYLLGEVARYVSPPLGDHRATFSIQALRMDSFMSIEHWFSNYISVQGLFLDGIKVFSDDLIHAEYTVFDEEGSSKVRAVIQRNGARVILSEYALPLSAYVSENTNLQRWSMSLFRLVNTSKDIDALTEQHAYLDIAGHLYPKGWQSKSKNYDSINDISATFGRTKTAKVSGEVELFLDSAQGIIETQLISKESFPDVELQMKEFISRYANDVSLVVDSYREIQRKPGNKERTVAYKPIRVFFSDTENKETVTMEYWLTYNESAEHYFIVGMLMPIQGFNYNLWAENVAAYNLILKSFFVNK